MPSVGSRSDGLRLLLSGNEVLSLRVVGAIEGIVVLAAGGRNGPGAGILLMSAQGLRWQAPGSSTPGSAIAIPSDGEYLLEDGEDPSCWLRVQAYTAWLPTSGQATVELLDLYNALGPDDVSAANATAGIVETNEYTLNNVTPAVIANATAWLDPTAVSAGISISSDGVTFVQPVAQTDSTALTWSTIAAGASVNLWIKRTIPAGASSNPKILNILRLSWNGV